MLEFLFKIYTDLKTPLMDINKFPMSRKLSKRKEDHEEIFMERRLTLTCSDLGSMSQANREGESSEEQEQVVTCDVEGALKFQAKEGATTNEEEDDFGTF
ncbi:hypothetical protein QJS10_CPB21g01025 [Acorus calamus]|uniref:Uncharacterized protein n=1 Tax=Acorus calamus TaxID=4465 RepID=A0AAV9C3N3_ACOCL|nr:hypothetical protein QJS10_CPB21g01025 [Acorus calamus]